MERFKARLPARRLFPVITYGGLISGVRKSPDPHRAMVISEELTALIPVMPMAIDVAETYATIRSGLAARGELIGNNDLWITAHPKSLEVILVTNNEKEFQRVSDLTIENWAKG